MNGIEKQADHYHGFLVPDRGLAPLAMALATIVALWILVYVVSAICGPEANQQMIEVAAAHALPGASQPP